MKRTLIALLILCTTFVVGAEVFILDFEGAVGEYLHGKSSGVYTTEQSGVTLEMSFEAGGTAGEDLFNLTGTPYFGINNSESGDDTDAFDDNEFMTISFNLSGTFQTIDFDRLTSGGSGDEGSLAFEDGITINFNGDSTLPLVINQAFAANKTITLRQTAGGSGTTWGFGLETITVDVVPEPTTIAMFGFGAMIAWVIRRSSRA